MLMILFSSIVAQAVPTSSTPTPTTTPRVGRKCILYSNGCRDTLSRTAFCCGWKQPETKREKKNVNWHFDEFG